MLSSLLDLVTNKRMINKDYDFIRELFFVLGKLLIIILIVSFIEFFIFFTTKIGRVIYVFLYLLLCLFFITESIVVNILLASKKQKILWLSSTPYLQVEKEYLLNVGQREVYDSTKDYSNTNEYDFVIYDYPPKGNMHLQDLLNTIISLKNPLDLVTYIEETVERVPLHYVDELWLLKNIRTYENAYDILRRVFNFISSLILLLLLFPIAYIFAIIHRIESRGSLFFIQQRSGYRGKNFNLIKFRTMVYNAEIDGPRFADKNDSRITGIGRIMRKFRIDEVPQLINVIKGEMNLIGPRPEREEFIGVLEKEIPYYKLRLEIRPGLTGWAQVKFSYAGNDINDHFEKLEYDLYYIKNRSLPLDILILLKTIKTVLKKKGT